MEASLRAIVLRRRDAGESDRRLTLFTFEEGKIDAVAKGARKATSRLASTSEPLVVSHMNVASGKHSRFITQAQPTSAFRQIRTDYDRLTQALALAELYAAVLPYEQPAPELFALFEQSLAQLETHPKPIVALTWGEARLMESSGFFPDFSRCVIDGSSIAVAEPFLSPHAGGFVSEESAGPFTDRYRVRAEVLYGLSKIVELELAPPNLKFAEETILALLPFWKHITDIAIPANESLAGQIRQLLHSRVQLG